MAIHNLAPLGEVHQIVNGTYANSTARTGETGFDSTHVNKVYRQLSDDTFWIVLSVASGVPTWHQLDGGGGGGGGLTYFVESLDDTGVNSSIPVHILKPTTGLGSHEDAAFPPLGAGGFMLAVPDGTSTGGNKRGTYSVDLQLQRTNATDVSSGDFSFSSGANNEASGRGSSTFGTYGADFGIYGKVTYGITYNNVVGNCQSSKITLGEMVSDATPTVLLTDRLNGTMANSQLILQDEQAITFTGRVIAKKVGATDIASWKIEGALVRGTGAATTVLLAPLVSVISNTPGWTLALSADTTNGGLTVTFTGQAATNTRFCCSIDTAEIR